MNLRTVLLFAFSFCLSTNLAAQILPSFGGSRTGTTGFQFLKIGVDARSGGLAGSVMATTNDVASLYWNPAGITKLDSQSVHVQASQTLYFANNNLSFIGIAHAVSKQTVIGFSMESFNTPYMPVTTEFQPTGTGQTFRASDLALGLTLGRLLTDQFSFGITAKYIRESFAEVHNNNAVLDFGFQYEVGKANSRFAVGISNFGFTTEPNGAIEVQTLTGVDTLTHFTKVGVPAIFRIGVASDVIKKDFNQLTLSAQLNHPTDNNETVGLGGEYSWKKTLFARGGYEFGVDEKGLPAFGFGIRFKRNFGMMQLDYGFQEKSKLGMTHRFTFSLSMF